jgi:uncharacterized protein (TIGR02646 family)
MGRGCWPGWMARKYLKERDGNYCVYCSKELKDEDTRVEHMVPSSKKGGSKKGWYNLALSCKVCDTKKGDRTILQYTKRFNLNIFNPIALAQIERCKQSIITGKSVIEIRQEEL